MLLLLVTLGFAASDHFWNNEELLLQEWKQFKFSFNKTYISSQEETYRLTIFRANLEKIHEHNTKDEGWKMGMNQFGDLTAEEFKQFVQRGGTYKKRLAGEIVGSDRSADLPTDVDWTTKTGIVTPVKNQGQCGSCWAFSTTGSIESRCAIKNGKLYSLSEQELVDCSKAEGNQGCQGGLMDDAFKYVAKEGGLCLENSYPYTAKNGLVCRQRFCGQKYCAISGFKDVRANDMDALMTAAVDGPVSVAVEADQNVWQLYKSGVVKSLCGSKLDHGVLVVGYGTSASGEKFWKVKNSWGGSWGEEGYIRLCRDCGKNLGRGECGILMQASYPIVK